MHNVFIQLYKQIQFLDMKTRIESLYLILIILYFLSFFPFLNVCGQSINNDVIASAGLHTESVNGYQLSWTIGEPIIETKAGVNTMLTSYLLTQGFHQPWEVQQTTYVKSSENPKIQLSVFPNPVRELLNVSVTNNEEILFFHLYDLSGRLIYKEETVPNQSLVKFNIRSLAAGSYFLSVRDKTNNFQNTYQLQKVK